MASVLREDDLILLGLQYGRREMLLAVVSGTEGPVVHSALGFQLPFPINKAPV